MKSRRRRFLVLLGLWLLLGSTLAACEFLQNEFMYIAPRGAAFDQLLEDAQRY